MHYRDISAEKNNKYISSQRKYKQEKIFSLSAFRQGYSLELFLADFEKYFDNEIDFNMAKIRKRIERPGALDAFIKRALKNNSHPVTEFIQDLFRELGTSGDIPWTGEL